MLRAGVRTGRRSGCDRRVLRGLLPALALLAALAVLGGPSVRTARAQMAQPGPVRPPAVAQAPIRMTLTALEGGPVLYRGLRSIRESAGRVNVTTRFGTAMGEVFQITEGIYDAETLAPVSWRLRDTRSGEDELMVRQEDTIRMSYKETGGAEPERDAVAMAPDLIFTPTVEPLIRRSWEELAAGKTVRFRLLVPNRQDVYRFRLVRDAGHSAAQEGRMVVRMEPDTWLVRQLVNPLFFVLDVEPPHRLREFRGRTSIRTEGGDPQDLRITYAYEGEG